MRVVPALLALSVTMIGCAAPGGTTGLTASSVCEDLGEALEAWAGVGFSGAFALSADGEECARGYGLADPRSGRPNDADTVFSIGSVSKAVTAAAVLDLVERADLALDEPVGEHLTSLAAPVAGLTVRQLLLHTGGLTGNHGRDHEPLDRDAALAAIGALEVRGEPGDTYGYSNAGYTLLAAVAEEAAGAPFREHLTERVLVLPGGGVAGGFWDGEPSAPGPRAVGVLADGSAGADGGFQGPHWALTGNGDVAMTVQDLADWTRGPVHRCAAVRRRGRSAGRHDPRPRRRSGRGARLGPARRPERPAGLRDRGRWQ